MTNPNPTPDESMQEAHRLRDVDLTAPLLLTDTNGQPAGVVQPDQIIDAGTRLAFALAAVCDDKAAVNRVTAETLAEVGTDSFGYIATAALSVLVNEILNPVLGCADAAGIHLRPGIRALSEGRDPSAERTTTSDRRTAPAATEWKA